MHIKVDIPIAPSYSEEFYEQSNLYKKRNYIYLLIKGLGVLGILTSILLVYLYTKVFVTTHLLVAGTAFFCGIYLLFNESRIKKKWLKQSIKSLKPYSTISWIFEEEGITQITNLSQSTLVWQVFPTVEETPKGLLFYQQKNIILYLPKENFDKPEDVEIVLQTFEQYPDTTVKRLKK